MFNVFSNGLAGKCLGKKIKKELLNAYGTPRIFMGRRDSNGIAHEKHRLSITMFCANFFFIGIQKKVIVTFS
jgi:hypothetical protein